jgi:hypothetical protein
MSYSNFTSRDLKEKFGIEQSFTQTRLVNVKPRPVSDLLVQSLARHTKMALSQGLEKARSEFIIAPILAELYDQAKTELSLFSGWELNVDFELGLVGRCDFLISRSNNQVYLESPIVVAVEAKQDDFKQGINQCIAEMVAARIFNEREVTDITRIYGCVTTGDVWRFLILDGKKVEIEEKVFELSEVEQILGILWEMAFEDTDKV